MTIEQWNTLMFQLYVMIQLQFRIHIQYYAQIGLYCKTYTK